VETLAVGRPAGPARRMIVIGASNVSRGLARFAAMVRTRTGSADLFLAAGHGRSYGAASRVGMRRLPSILGCGLWRALDREPLDAIAARPAAVGPPVALVTDIGNDLLYGFGAVQVGDWVRETLRRLADRGARVAVTRLPLESLAGVGPTRYRLLRSIYVPHCTLSLGQLRDATAELDARVVSAAAECDAMIIDQPAAWYGLDAIHVRRDRLDELWRRVCEAWEIDAAGGGLRAHPPEASFADWAVLGSAAAEVRGFGRMMLRTPQPAVTRRGPLRVWMY
jgi:hypothetical protein